MFMTHDSRQSSLLRNQMRVQVKSAGLMNNDDQAAQENTAYSLLEGQPKILTIKLKIFLMNVTNQESH